MSQHRRTGVIQHHAGGMQHPAHHVDGMLGAFKPLLKLLCLPTCILDLDILPAVDVNLLDAGPEHIPGQKGELRHLRIDGVHQILSAHALHGDPVVLHIFGDIALDLGLGILPAFIHDQRGILAGNILLYLLQNRGEFPGVVLRGEEQVMGPERCSALLELYRLVLLFYIPNSRRLHGSCMCLGIGHAYRCSRDPGSGGKNWRSGVFFLCRSSRHPYSRHPYPVHVCVLFPASSRHRLFEFLCPISIAVHGFHGSVILVVLSLCNAGSLSISRRRLPHCRAKQFLRPLFS